MYRQKSKINVKSNRSTDKYVIAILMNHEFPFWFSLSTGKTMKMKPSALHFFRRYKTTKFSLDIYTSKEE
jgi:hypothetical protein